MDIFNTPYLYAKRYVTKTMLDNDIFVFPRFDADRDDKYQNYIISYPDLVASIAANLPAGGGVASVTLNNLLPLFTVSNTGTAVNPIFTFVAPPQAANLVYAGPAAGAPAIPTFRALTLADMPAGIDAQDLANVLSVGNTTNEIAMISNNGFSSLSLFDASAILTYTDGNAFATLNLDTANPYLQFYDGASQIGTFGMDYPNQWLVINHTSQIRNTAPIIIEQCTDYGYSFSTPGRILQTNVGTGYVESSIVTVAELDTIGSVAQGVIAGYVYTTDGAGVASWQPLPGSSLATCLLDFYVTNINSCSPLHINPTNGQDVYMVEAGGKVGVGTITPSAKLHVVGQTSDATTYAIKAQDSTLNLNFYVQNDGAVSSRLGYWIDGNRILHQQGHITSIYCGLTAGASATGAATFNTALGYNALTANLIGVANVALGYGTLAAYLGDRAVAIGQGSLGSNISGGANTGVGDSTLSSAINGENTALGFIAGFTITTGSNNTFIGSRSGYIDQLATANYSIAIGYNTHTNANNQCVIGEQQGFGQISEFVLGYGPDQPVFTTGDTMIRPTNVRAGVTDIANDYNIIYAGGRGTGTGKGSDIIFKVAPAGATGSTQNPYVEILRFKNTGIINVASMQTGNAGLASGDLYVDTAANILANGDLVVGRKV